MKVRIKRITIENFKNVEKGTVDLENKRKNYQGSVLGIYGQNGSGKTSLIDAVDILKQALAGREINQRYAEFINIDADYARLGFEFTIHLENVVYNVWYEFSLIRGADSDDYIDVHGNWDLAENAEYFNERPQIKVMVCDEVLSYCCESGDKRTRKTTLIDTRTDVAFVPRTKYKELVGNIESYDVSGRLMAEKIMARTSSRSFIFSANVLEIFEKNCKNEIYKTLIMALNKYGKAYLYVINNHQSGMLSLDTLPLNIRYEEENRIVTGVTMIYLNKPMPVIENKYKVVANAIENMNIVLREIVPGLKLAVKDLGPVMAKDGSAGRYIQIVSLKNDKEIPLTGESEGIKKIISVLQLLITVYNNPSVTVAIDELDGGIFEYLLGEILNIISEKGKGQLIFTSHNLRPLETIDKGFVVFTTTNPKNRYIRFTNVKETNNLRDFYYRDIVLGEQSEQVYDPTNKYDIALAFREAGGIFGS